MAVTGVGGSVCEMQEMRVIVDIEETLDGGAGMGSRNGYVGG